jgi:hypothetical protein
VSKGKQRIDRFSDAHNGHALISARRAVVAIVRGYGRPGDIRIWRNLIEIWRENGAAALPLPHAQRASGRFPSFRVD